MRGEEENDQFLNAIFKEVGLKSPSDDYTKRLMKEVEVLHSSGFRIDKDRTANWLISAAAGYIGWGIIGMVLWITGILDMLIDLVTNFLLPIVDFTGFPLLIGVIIYLILARLSFIIFILLRFPEFKKITS